jgi:hypothetical protein
VPIVKTYPQMKVVCVHCGAEKLMRWTRQNINDVLKPYPGGGEYGRCLRCKRTGLRVKEIPKKAPEKPVGWREIPEK